MINKPHAWWALCLLTLILLAGCRPPVPKLTEEPPTQEATLFAVDAGGRQIDALQAGSSLHIGAEGFEPNQVYEFRLGVGDGPLASLDEAVSFARASTDNEGGIRSHILWYQLGVVGCAVRAEDRLKLPFAFRTFDDAEETLPGQMLTITVHPVEEDRKGRLHPMELQVGEALAAMELPVVARTSPMVYPSDEGACLINSMEAQAADMVVSGRNFAPGEEVLISVVPNQRAWYIGDAVNDITGVGRAGAPTRVTVDANGRFTERVWDAELQRRGEYDIVVQRELARREILDEVLDTDIISFGADTGFILSLRWPPGGPTMDIAGRQLSGSPYFQFADSFADQGDTVWGAVDPTYVPPLHPGGTYAAYYVVNHRDVAGWDPSMGGSINLVDVSGGIEVHPVKAGCINGTDVVIWNSPLTIGEYDVVVDFGMTPASSAATYTTDGEYNDAQDFLDGADQIGFVVAHDPYDLGSIPIGEASYSTDDFFPTLGAASNVDLRAVVRYPATTAGVNTPVAAGQHPLFIIEHGNHWHCDVDTSDLPYEDVYAEYLTGLISSSELISRTYSHAVCPDRTENHEGYMRLLEILASHGIIAVSIDAYDLTGFVPQWIPERGTLILKHLELWSHMDDPSTFPVYNDYFAGRFNNHVDMNKISVSGHSRGGEASVAAYMLNTSFNIGSVSSIAPVDGQNYVLPDVPFFVILPAADGDVSSLSGMEIFDRAGNATVPTPDSTTKSGIHTYGANHNFFNTVWASHSDDSDPTRDDYIAAADQQRLGEAYLSAFTRTNLTNEVVYEDMLRGGLVFPSTAGFKNYYFRHEKDHEKVYSGGSSGTPSGLTTTPVTNPSVHDTQVLRVNWNSSGDTLTFTLPSSGTWDASTFEVLSLRVTQTNASVNPASGPQDFRVELVGGSVMRSFYTSKFDPIPKPYDHPYYSSDHNVMTTVRIPLHSFIMNNSGMPLNAVDTIRFVFSNPAQGEIYVDDIEFSR